MTPLSHENTGWLPMPFSDSFGQDFLDPENRLYRREATRSRRRYRRISDYFEIVCLCSPHIPGMRLAALMRAFASTAAILETSPFAMLLLLWCFSVRLGIKGLISVTCMHYCVLVYLMPHYCVFLP